MHGGGAERVAALLCNHWAEQGHRVMLVPTFSGRGDCVYPLDKRVQLVYLADRVGTTRRSPLTLPRRFLAMWQLVREWRPDCVISFLPHVNVAALMVTRGLKMSVVVSERTYPPAMPMGQFWSRLRRWTYPWASTVVMQTLRGSEWLAVESPRARSVVIPNPCVYPLPVSEPYLDPAVWIGSARRVVLAVGRLGEEKGFSGLINAFAQLVECFPGWDLVILGEGDERAALEARVEKLRLSARILLPGRVGNMADWYQRAELYVMSSRFEGFPNTLLEALAHGLPAVSFDCETGPADIIREWVDGILVPPSDGEEGLTQAMVTLMQDDERLRCMGKAATTVRDRFSPERVMAQWDDALGLNK
ncbi:glycosyltransferase family 4 protein [Marinobacter koreensis]